MNILRSLLSKDEDSLSSKRFLGLVCVLTLDIVLILSLFIENIQLNSALIDAIGLLAFGLLGLTSVETISQKKPFIRRTPPYDENINYRSPDGEELG